MSRGARPDVEELQRTLAVLESELHLRKQAEIEELKCTLASLEEKLQLQKGGAGGAGKAGAPAGLRPHAKPELAKPLVQPQPRGAADDPVLGKAGAIAGLGPRGTGRGGARKEFARASDDSALLGRGRGRGRGHFGGRGVGVFGGGGFVGDYHGMTSTASAGYDGGTFGGSGEFGGGGRNGGAIRGQYGGCGLSFGMPSGVQPVQATAIPGAACAPSASGNSNGFLYSFAQPLPPNAGGTSASGCAPNGLGGRGGGRGCSGGGGSFSGQAQPHNSAFGQAQPLAGAACTAHGAAPGRLAAPAPPQSGVGGGRGGGAGGRGGARGSACAASAAAAAAASAGDVAVPLGAAAGGRGSGGRGRGSGTAGAGAPPLSAAAEGGSSGWVAAENGGAAEGWAGAEGSGRGRGRGRGAALDAAGGRGRGRGGSNSLATAAAAFAAAGGPAAPIPAPAQPKPAPATYIQSPPLPHAAPGAGRGAGRGMAAGAAGGECGAGRGRGGGAAQAGLAPEAAQQAPLARPVTEVALEQQPQAREQRGPSQAAAQVQPASASGSFSFSSGMPQPAARRTLAPQQPQQPFQQQPLPQAAAQAAGSARAANPTSSAAALDPRHPYALARQLEAAERQAETEHAQQAAAEAADAGEVAEGWIWSIPANTPTSRVIATLGFSPREVVELNASYWSEDDYTPFADELMRAFGVQLSPLQIDRLQAIRATRPHDIKALSLGELLINMQVTMMPYCNSALLILIRRVSEKARMLVTKLIDSIELAWADINAMGESGGEPSTGCICVALDGCEPGVLHTVRANGTIGRHVVFELALEK